LALYREGRNAEQNYFISYAILSYYKIIELKFGEFDGRKVRAWIKANYPAVAADKKPTMQNEFSGPGYRVINFVADLPVRIDKYLCRTPDDPLFVENGTVVFVLTEFQIIDARQAEANERGENSHEKYKERQFARVKARLMHGMKDEGSD